MVRFALESRVSVDYGRLFFTIDPDMSLFALFTQFFLPLASDMNSAAET